VPLDEKTLLISVKKTSRAIVIDEGHQSYGVTAEIAARLNEKAFYHLDAPVLGWARWTCRCPSARRWRT
jgi:pyruvate/2-oxoglutarate/acetoin dehydrogenase E1 component